MKQYETYKDSGIEWLGKVPGHWTVSQLKRLLNTPLMYGSNDYAESTDTSFPRYIRITDIADDGTLKADTFKSLSPEKAAGYMLVRGDVLFARSGATVGKTFLYESDQPACFAGYLIKAQCKKDILYPKYLIYYTRSNSYTNWKNSIFAQATIQNIGADKYSILPLPIPPHSEQERIVEYLDAKCGDIDNRIAVLEKEQKAYERLKVAVINRAVTEGLDPETPKRDSGLDWLGMIPEHWEVKRLKECFSMGKGLSITKDDLRETGSSVISYGQIHAKNNSGVTIKQDFIRYVNESYCLTNPQAIVPKGGFIFADTSEDVLGSGNCIYQDRDEVILGGYHTVILYPKESNDNKYLAYLFQTDKWRKQIRSNVYGIKVMSITQTILGKCSIVLPPYSEQKAIAEYLDTKCAAIDAKIGNIAKRIEAYKRLKRALINEVVTGKRAV